MFKKILFLIIIFCFFNSLNSVSVSKENEGSMIYISNTEIGNYTTIQEGIDAANSGDTIYVYNGSYYENIVIDKSIFLIGENINSTIIDGRVAGNTVKVNANHVTIKGFTIQHSGLIYPNSGINLSSNYNIVEGNLITDNFYGITLYFSSGNIIRGNTIQKDDHCGIYLSSSSNNTIVNNSIKDNTYNGIGAYYSSDSNFIRGNNFKNNGFCGVNIRISKENNIFDNDFSDNNIAIHLPPKNIENNNDFSNNNVDIEREITLSGNEPYLFVGLIIVGIIVGFIIYIRRTKFTKK
ncbi:MAG: hypothetical protein AYK22_06780 [Thermoplasmatales archaeon SG8-52-3]|nr:MAG: hypothetical protein AYK22_06780 [Thermoplasmatales archaeon SG8-52-3]